MQTTDDDNAGAAILPTALQRSARIMPSAHARGVWCHMLPMAHFTGCSQQRITENIPEEAEQQPECSFHWISLSQDWEFLSWKSPLPGFGLPFNKCLLGIFPSSWQHTQQVNSSTGLMCSDTTSQANSHLHSGADSCPPKWLVKSSASKDPQLSLTWIIFHPGIQGHFGEGPLWCQTLFLHHRKVLATLE